MEEFRLPERRKTIDMLIPIFFSEVHCPGGLHFHQVFNFQVLNATDSTRSGDH